MAARRAGRCRHWLAGPGGRLRPAPRPGRGRARARQARAKRRVSPDAAARPLSLISDHVSAGWVRRPGAAQGRCRRCGRGAGPVTRPEPQWHVAECLLPGLSRATAEALGRRVRRALAGPPGSQVSFLGSLLMPQDEVLLCLFAGPEAEVRAVSERPASPSSASLPALRSAGGQAGPRPRMSQAGRTGRTGGKGRGTCPVARTRTHGDPGPEVSGSGAGAHAARGSGRPTRSPLPGRRG